MKTDLTIKSEIFSAYNGEEQEINPGRFGKKLGEFVKIQLEDKGIPVADIYPTDYSYELRVDHFNFSIYILTGNIDGESNHFFISLEPKKEYIRKWFKKVSTKDSINKIYKIVYDAICNHDKIEIITAQ